jgi:predicted secreted Zn-dependent protease
MGLDLAARRGLVVRLHGRSIARICHAGGWGLGLGVDLALRRLLRGATTACPEEPEQRGSSKSSFGHRLWLRVQGGDGPWVSRACAAQHATRYVVASTTSKGRVAPVMLSLFGLLACGVKGPPPQVSFRPDQDSARVEVSSESSTYPVAGRTRRQLRRQMNELGPENEDSAFDAFTTWHVDWKYDWEVGEHSCGVRSSSVQVAIHYAMPAARPDQWWRSALSRRWSAYLESLWAHELGHGELAIQHAEILLDELERAGANPTCPDLDAALQELGDARLERLRAAEQTYDEQTDHGRREGARWP